MNANEGASPRVAAVNTNDIDLSKVLDLLRRHWLPLILIPSLTAGGTYALLNRIAPTYQARTSLMSGASTSGNATLNGAVASAAQLPEGAVSEVVHSRALVERVISTVQTSSLPEQVKSRVAEDLRSELSTGRYQRLQVSAKIDSQQRGVYDLTSEAESPDAARILANAAARALLAWDIDRARSGVTQARRNIQQQLTSITARLATLSAGSVERDSLVAARGQLLLSLSQATVFEQGPVGSLVLLAEANNPSQPVAPKPARNAALAFLLAVFATAGGILLRDSLRRKISAVTDLPPGLPVLGTVPRMTRVKRPTFLQQARSSGAYEAGGFIQVNLLSRLGGQQHPVVVVTSPSPFNGKSTVTALTAGALAAAGKRVLVIDLDLHRPAQHEFWGTGGREWQPLPGAMSTPAMQGSVLQAFEHPQHASVLIVAENVDLMPAQSISRQASSLLNNPAFMQRIRDWAQHYDMVLLDLPPVLALSDALLVGQHSDGVILVVSADETSTQELGKSLDAFGATQAKLLGVVLNKVPKSSGDYSYYSYGG